MYILSLAVMFSFSSISSFWLSIEINMVLFILLVYCLEWWKGRSTSFGLNYFILQSMGSIVLLVSSLESSLIGFEMWCLVLYSSLLIKLGLFPFFFWVYQLTPMLSWFTLSVLLTYHKVPLLSFCSLFSSNFLMTAFLVNMSIGCFFICLSESTLSLVVSSSIYTSFWFLLFVFNSFMFSLIYSTFYFLSLTLLGLSGAFSSFFIPFSLMFLIGLPPFNPFILKFFSIMDLIQFSGLVILLMIWIFTFVSTVGYLKFMFCFFRSSYYSVNFFKFNDQPTFSIFLLASLTGIFLLL